MGINLQPLHNVIAVLASWLYQSYIFSSFFGVTLCNGATALRLLLNIKIN